MSSLQTAFSFLPLPNYGKHMPWANFVAQVMQGSIDDYDGYGHLATAACRSTVVIHPSDLRAPHGYSKPEWATHVVWFDR
jgi:hypothetical protein